MIAYLALRSIRTDEVLIERGELLMKRLDWLRLLRNDLDHNEQQKGMPEMIRLQRLPKPQEV